MKLIMAGLDHNRSDIEVREKFALTKERTGKILSSVKESGLVGGCVIITTCNRTEFYASVPADALYEPSKTLCEMLNRDYFEYKQFFTERADRQAIDHLCRVASGLDSQIIGDDQIITQVREALELSRERGCTDGYIETMFKTAIQAAKKVKTNVILKTLGIDSVPDKAVAKLKTICPLAGWSAVVIGNGQTGRLVSQLLIHENVNVTVTLRQYKKGAIQVPKGANTILYSERYGAIGHADIVVSATTSPHFTLTYGELCKLEHIPGIIVDLAVPRDAEPSIGGIPGVALLTIDDIAGDESRKIPPKSAKEIDSIISKHIEQYYRWFAFKESFVHAGGSK